MNLEELIKRTEDELAENEGTLQFHRDELLRQEDRVRNATKEVKNSEELLTKLKTLK